MRYYIIAGEASGDLHAANCMQELKQIDASAQFAFTGGDKMQEVSGVKPDIHIRNMAFMGFIDVLKNIGTIKRNFNIVKTAILKFKPQVLLLVDYPGFNLRMAKWATEQGIKVEYYISPTVWAWKEGRVEQIRNFTNKLFVILPFEEAFYQKHNLKVYFVGHPLLDEIQKRGPTFRSAEKFVKENNLSGKPIIAVLPGSRAQEIERMLHIMIEVMPQFSNYEFVVAGAPSLHNKHYQPLYDKGIKVLFDQTYELMKSAKAGIIKSGTSTLESALLDLPQVVCYKGGALSFAIGKRLVKIDYISLPNLILQRHAVKELIQNDLTAGNIATELNKLLNEANYRATILDAYQEVKNKLGGGGASARVAAYLKEDAAE